MARAALPLKSLLSQRGDGPASGGNWGSFKCPFCQKPGKKKSAGVFEKGGREWFKCHRPDCPTSGKGLDEAGYLAQKLNWSRRDAFMTWLKEAGVEVKIERAEGRGSRDEGRGSRDEGRVEDGRGSMVEGRVEDWEGLRDGADDELQPDAGINRIGTHKASECPGAQSAGGDDGANSQAAAPPPDITTADAPPAMSTMLQNSTHPQVAGGAASEESGERDGNDGRDENGERYKRDEGNADDGEDDGDVGQSAVLALREFYEGAAHLTEERLDELWRKRGLTRETADWAGLKLSCEANRAVLEGMRSKYDLATLIRAGLYTVPKGGEYSKAGPNAQLCGWGFIRKKRDAAGKKMDDWETGWIEPVLIPYFNKGGELVHLRPHKGMQRDERSRLFVARPRNGWMGKRNEGRGAEVGEGCAQGETEVLVVTEGEFKALALVQTLNEGLPCGVGRYAAAALPGITNAKNWFVWEPLKDLLEETQPKTVVVAYDSEEKGEPKLPGYTPNKWARHDSVVWARYLVEKIAGESHNTKLSVLPKEWRDENGKADWDGALAKLIGDKTWAEAKGRCRAAFERVLKAGRPSWEFNQLTLLPNDEAFIIERQLARITYTPKLPHGGTDEKRIVHKLRKLIREQRRRKRALDDGKVLAGRESYVFVDGAVRSLAQLAAAYQAIDGCYYTVREPHSKEKSSAEESTRQNWRFRLGRAKDAGDDEAAWACALALKGTPEPAGDFFMVPYFIMQRSNGTQERYVKVLGVHGGRTDVVPWDAKSFSHPRDFRVWLANCKGGYAWFAGEKELEKLQTDTNAATSGKIVTEVPYFGWHAESRLWLYDDCAWTPEGGCITPDKHGVIWHGGEGYKVGERDLEDQEFAAGRPRMQPGKILVRNESGDGYRMEPGAYEKQDPVTVREFFGEYAERLFETLGGYDAWMAMGGTALYMAMPEVFAQYSGCGGLWFHGETQQGKSSVARWQMRWHGFNRDDGHNVRKISDVHLAVMLNQYSNMIVWIEEFKSDVSVSKQEAIKCCYNREGGGKWAPGGQRRVRTVPIVTGESTSNDAATRSRYPHILVSKSRRLLSDGHPVNWFAWFQKHRGMYYVFGRELLRHRAAFSAEVMRLTEEFRTLPEVEGIEHRAALVYGNVYGAFCALERVFCGPIYPKARLDEFRKHCVAECLNAVTEVRTRVNVEVFLQEIVNLFARDKFGRSVEELRRFFHVERTVLEHAPGHPDQEYWASYKLYVAPTPLFGAMREALRTEGRTLPLEPGDTRAQMAQRAYFVRGSHTKRFGHSSMKCWCINLDLCEEFGYTPQSTEAVLEAKTKAVESGLTPNGERLIETALDEWDWNDPRRGPLYGIVERLQRRRG